MIISITLIYIVAYVRGCYKKPRSVMRNGLSDSLVILFPLFSVLNAVPVAALLTIISRFIDGYYYTRVSETEKR